MADEHTEQMSLLKLVSLNDRYEQPIWNRHLETSGWVHNNNDTDYPVARTTMLFSNHSTDYIYRAMNGPMDI